MKLFLALTISQALTGHLCFHIYTRRLPFAEGLSGHLSEPAIPEQGGSDVRALEDVRSRPQGRIDCFEAQIPFLGRVVASSFSDSETEKRKPRMSTERYPRKAVIGAPDGLTPQLKTKSRARRERQRTLAGIADHAPKRRNDLLPTLAVSYVPIEELRQAPRRVRRAHAEQVARIRASIEKFGVCQPVLISKDRTIVHGHGVVEATRATGLTKIPVIFVEHLSPAELRLLSITLNRLGETGQWDEEALRIEFAELIDLGEDVVVSGFEAAEIDHLLLDDASDDGVGELNPALVAAGKAISRRGDLWVLGRHRLLQADARSPASYERLMLSGEQARLVLTDEPYNVPNVGHVTSQAHHREFAMAAGEMSREEFWAQPRLDVERSVLRHRRRPYRDVHRLAQRRTGPRLRS
jgi:ParB-like chromosome segregation protein Spo0J